MKRIKSFFLLSFLVAGSLVILIGAQIVQSAGPPPVVLEMVEK